MARPLNAVGRGGVAEPADAVFALVAGVPEFVDAVLAHDPNALADAFVPLPLGRREYGIDLVRDKLDQLAWKLGVLLVRRRDADPQRCENAKPDQRRAARWAVSRDQKRETAQRVWFTHLLRHRS